MAVKLSDHFTYSKIFKAVIAPILMMIFTSIYGVVDGIFVSNFAQDGAFAGLNLIYPVIMIVGGVGFMIGTGGSALVSKLLGEQEKERANQVFSMMVIFTAIFGAIISVIGSLLIKPIALALASVGEGNTENMIKYAIIYGRILMLGQVTFMLQNLFQSFFVVAEKPQLGFIYTVSAGVTNIILDALFIAVFKWGIVGAALATIAGQIVGGFFPLIYFIKRKDGLIHLVKTKLELKPILKSLGNGSSEFVNSVSSSIVGMVYNIQLLRYLGEEGVSAYGIIMYVQFIFVAIYVGYAIGTAPIIGYNYGAQNHKELKNVLKKSMIILSTLGVIMLTLAEVFAKPLCSIFASMNPSLLQTTINGMRIYSIGFLMCGVSIFISSFFTALNNGLVSAIISMLRTLLFQLVCVIVLPLILKENGIWLSVVISEVLALILCLTFLMANKKRYNY